MRPALTSWRGGASGLAVLAVGALSFVALAQAAPETPQATTCGIPYVFHVGHKKVPSGSCSGQLPAHPPTLAIRPGQHFWVRIESEQNGKLDYPVPAPGNSWVERVARRGARVYYVAEHHGKTRLFANHTRFCQASNPKMGSCAVLKVAIAGTPPHHF